MLSLTTSHDPTMEVVNDARCRCNHQVAAGDNSKVVFKGLKLNEEYFPMVARKEDNSYFALPPSPTAPRVANDSNKGTQDALMYTNSRPSGPKLTTAHHGSLNNNMINIRSDGESDEDRYRMPSVRNVVTNANIPRPVARNQPSGPHQNTQSGENINERAYLVDVATWQDWRDDMFPRIFAKFAPKSARRTLVVAIILISFF